MARTTLVIFVVFTVLAVISTVDAMNPCSVSKMREAYSQMRGANCKNCDKYFHCKGNYNAVHQCSGPLRISTATALSNARELFGGNYGSADSNADQVANEYGRRGGNCDARYLRAVKCYWNPNTKKCQK